MQLRQFPLHDFEFLGLVAGQALRIQVARQHDVGHAGHVGRRQRQRRQNVQIARAVADFLLELAVCALLDGFVAIEPALRQTEFVTVDAGAVFAHQQHGVVVAHRHDDDGAETGAFQPLVGAAFAVGKFKIDQFDLEELAAIGKPRGMNDRWFAHPHILPRSMPTG